MLFDKFSALSPQLSNRRVLAPLTRSLATPQATPNALMAMYYGQRATAGLIITEATFYVPGTRGHTDSTALTTITAVFERQAKREVPSRVVLDFAGEVPTFAHPTAASAFMATGITILSLKLHSGELHVLQQRQLRSVCAST